MYRMRQLSKPVARISRLAARTASTYQSSAIVAVAATASQEQAYGRGYSWLTLPLAGLVLGNV